MDALDVNLVKKILPGSALFGEILTHEKELCTYNNTVKIVKLLGDLFEHHQVHMAPVLNVVFDEIFGAHLSWQYASLFQKVELSIALLKLIGQILDKKSKEQGVLVYKKKSSNEKP